MEKDASPPMAPDLEASPSPEPKPRQSSFTRRWKESVDPTHADLICLLLCFLTGLCDSSAYNAWSCFLGMQTGGYSLSLHSFLLSSSPLLLLTFPHAGISRKLTWVLYE